MSTTRPQLRRLPLGAIQPRGWLREQAVIDLEEGLLGRLDALTSHARNDLFATRCPAGAPPDHWWDAETRGNWLWGYAMTAYQVGDAGHVRRVDRLLDALRDTCDSDGYLGIYGPHERFRHPEGENGELWAQSRALLPLLARHEFTGNTADLRAVERAVALTIRQYGPSRSCFRIAPARRRSALTGLTHGLCYADVLEQLHAITGDAACARFGAWLYGDFSRWTPFPNDDIALPNLLEADRPWSGHAVHTAAHLRALLFAHAVTGRADLATGVRHAVGKLRTSVLPAGALPGDEAIHGVPLPDSAYELCTTVELGLSLASALQRTGDAAFGDWIEALFFNGFHGARLTDGRAVSYLSADTRVAAAAERSDAYSLGRAGRRFKFSPTHDDVACCCAPNAGRALPQYVSRRWMALLDGPGLALATYGPSAVTTTIDGVAVAVEAVTDYPFADEIEVRITPSSPVAFTLWLRKPAWARRVSVRAPGATVVDESSDWCRVHKTWSGDIVAVTLGTSVRAVPYQNGEFALMRGALQFVLPLDPLFESIRDYEVAAFHDFDLWPRDPAQACHLPLLEAGAVDLGARVDHAGREVARPWASPPLRLRLGRSLLVPMGAAPLRRAGFLLRRPRATSSGAESG